MSRYDDLFYELAADESVFADKGALDPLAEPNELVPRTNQGRALGRILTGVTEGYLPTTVPDAVLIVLDDARLEQALVGAAYPIAHTAAESPADPVVVDEGEVWQAIAPAEQVITNLVQRYGEPGITDSVSSGLSSSRCRMSRSTISSSRRRLSARTVRRMTSITDSREAP